MTDTQAPPDTVILTINGKQIEAKPGELVIEAAERTGTYIPRFCYHPRMEPVGMCRMCIVEIDTGRGPSLQPSCMLPVAPDMVVDTESDVTRKAQDGVLEFFLINHPLDCPVCDKGGECPLQDQTLTYGPGETRFVEEKRHFAKPIPISDLVHLDRERCILCDRCTRFADDVAGDTLIHFIDRGSQTQVNTFPDHPFASYFSGNTVQICPVGALLASPYRFKARPWDLEQVESTCTTCSVGCRVVVQSSRNEVVRKNGVDVDPVNWGWLCDKGRFDFQSLNADERLGSPLVLEGGSMVPAGWGRALSQAAAALRGADPSRVAVIGGARLTNEDAYAWAKLAKGVIGTDNVDAQLGDGLPAEAVLGLPRATIDDACSPGGTVLLMGPDIKEELPVLFLRLRHAVLRDNVTLVEMSPRRTSLSPLAAATMLHRPGTAGEVVAALLAGRADREVGGISPDAIESAGALLAEGPVTVVLGRASLAESPEAVVAAAAAIHRAHPNVRFLSALRRGNVHGAIDMGLAPGMLPGRVTLADGAQWFRDGGWPNVPTTRGLDTAGILEAAASGKLDVLVLLGADPLTDFPDTDLATRGLAGARTVIAVDQFPRSGTHADVVLAAAGYAEVDGTTTNIEGRISTVARKVTPPGTARSDWMIAAELARLLGTNLGIESVDDIWTEIESLAPSHAGITLDLLRSAEARDGLVAPLQPGSAAAPDEISSTEGAAPSGTHGGPGSEEVAASMAGGAAQDAADSQVDEQTAAGAAASSAADATQAEADAPDSSGDAAAPLAAERSGPNRPPVVSYEGPSSTSGPALDAYALRLVATRKLYDLGSSTQRSPHLAPLAAPSILRMHPYDFDRLGVEPGTTLTVTSARGAIAVAVEPDTSVPKGSAAAYFNQPGPSIGALIDADAAVTEVRVELT